MEEADSLSLKIEENDLGNDLKEQIDQYNIYINFLNDYYNNSNANPIQLIRIYQKNFLQINGVLK